MTIIDKIVKKYSRKHHIIADPNKYFPCPKRQINAQITLTERQLENCKVLPSREELIKRIPQGGVCAEVGVAEGYFSDLILKNIKPQKLYMIEYSEKYVKDLRVRFNQEIQEGIVEILEGDSVKMLKTLEDHSLDFVFLDATHDYEHPKAELNVCKDKVKTEGIIAGHDYTRFSMWESSQYGVIEAVNEFAIKNDYEMVYYTMDMLHSNASYALRKK